jgi:hypothetical protein
VPFASSSASRTLPVAAKLRAVTALASAQRAAEPPGERNRDVIVVTTAIWDIAALSAEEALVFVDRLQFEAATDAVAVAPAEEPQAWASPEDKIREFMTHLGRPAAEDRSPQFLFLARMGDEQLADAYAEAFALARRNAESLAQAAGMRLGKLASVHHNLGGPELGRTDKIMNMQRCGALLAGSSYELGENEMVSDDLRSAAFTVKVHVQYQAE